MSFTLRENITAVIETCFSETKDEIQEVAINKILELIRNDKADRKTENSSEKPNNSDTISRQAAISAICNACGKIDCDKMDKCEKLQLPPANCSEFPNNCEDLQDWKDRMWAEAIVTEPTISKMEQVDKDINVRSKDEPQWTKENCKGCKYNEYPYDSGTCFVRVCINGNKYEPKDEPQTEREDE